MELYWISRKGHNNNEYFWVSSPSVGVEHFLSNCGMCMGE